MDRIEIPITKLTGAGNDFVAVDNTRGRLQVDWSAFAKAVCERHYGVGADGLLVLAPSSRADFTMLYYNADGSSGGMCGNGGRCCVLFARENGVEHDDISFEALGYLYKATFTGAGIRVAMKDPERIRRGVLVHATAGKFLCHAVNTGSPHVVTFVDDIESVDVTSTGRELRGHTEFMPEGTNVNFVQVLGKDTIAIRTYERGVEAETLACGTGSIASAVMAAIERGAPSPVIVRTRSGEILRVGFTFNGENVTSISLEGHARIIFSSSILYNTLSNKIEAQIAV
jgi:diaminopimelate epimerase